MKTPTFSINKLAEELEVDRRTLKRILGKVPPASRKGGPRWTLEAARDALESHRQSKAKAATARERLIEAQVAKLSLQIAILKREHVAVSDVERWGAELGEAIRKVVGQLHLSAPSIVGLSVADAEARLRDVEDDVIGQLHLLGSTLERLRDESAR